MLKITFCLLIITYDGVIRVSKSVDLGLRYREATPPGSPGAARRARDLDVFQRLAVAASAASPDNPFGSHRSRLRQLPRPKRAVGGGGNITLQCTHVAEGHTGAVLALAAAGGALYSGGADRSVRQWDLASGGEVWRGTCGAAVAALAVRSPLVAAGAGPGVHVFDARTPQPVATLWCAERGSRQAAVTCIAPAPADTQLYSAAADRLRLWDLRKLKCVWAGAAGHTAAVMCVGVVAEPGDTHLLLSGSKDHYVRALRLRPSTGEVLARTLLLPPHYDGVQSLAAISEPGSVTARVYSASRDMTLKRWDLDAAAPTHTVTGAHKSWVTGVLVLSGPEAAVASCGRDGALRLWDAELRPVAQAQAPDALHALAYRSPHALYTAGNGGEVRAWRVVSEP
ncbi:Kinesin-like protein KIF21A [Eumeta japonica]|uniref:Kinesin-like protein KIF21A n=1 Tax=Eumeta variegata TaxID=151549 RepID=A0A4C1VLH5_EUMVA|nr:Kinesin-like protein KIF21A [Eumeta japonica]